MNQSESWVLFRAEPSGMQRPLYVIEIAAQRMLGYQPDGLSFRVLLNHEVSLDAASLAMHGYSQEYLRQHGQEPRLAHRLFSDYVGSRPLVSHNLPMGWERLMVPECQRLGIALPGSRGFCSLSLARRVLPEASSFSLSSLNKRCHLVDGDLRGAAPDVAALVKLFQDWLGPRLTAASIVGFQAVAEFSRQTPPAKCRKRIEDALQNKALPAPSALTASPRTPADCQAEFQQLVREIMADGVMTTAEFLVLMDWLRDCPHTDLYPINRLQEAIERVTAQDGQVTAEDQEKLEAAFRYYLTTGKAPPRPGETA